MKLIRVTTQDEQGNQTYNVPIAVMTEQDYLYIQGVMEADVKIHEAVALRFDATEKIVSLLNQKLDLLAQEVLALKFRNTRLR